MKLAYRTCTEHEHCQEEIQETDWDDKSNTYVVVHHRDADSQDDSPAAPERFIRAAELGEWVQRLDDRARGIEGLFGSLEKTLARLESATLELEAGALRREHAHDARARALDTRAVRQDAAYFDHEALLEEIDYMVRLLEYRSLSRREQRRRKKAEAAEAGC